MKKTPQAAERAKQILLADYPYTSYAEFARNPKNNSFVKSTEEVENEYKRAYALYESEKFTESKEVIDQTIQKYPKDALVPKLYLLNAFNTGKASGKEVMILQLEQIALNYSKTPEGIRAKEMLNYLKSDLSFQATDNKGNAIPQEQVSPAPSANKNKNIPDGANGNLNSQGKLKINNSDQQAQSIPTGNMDNNPQQKPEKPKLRNKNVPDGPQKQ